MRGFALAFGAAVILATAAAPAANPPPPKGVVTFEAPAETDPGFKAGAGVEKLQTYCVTCHSSAYVSTQPILTSAQWTAEVKKMRGVYGATIPDDAAATIVLYLTTEYGKP